MPRLIVCRFWQRAKFYNSHFFFRFSVQKTGNEFSPLFWLLVDDDRYLNTGLVLSDDPDPSTSIIINIQLTAGQIVRVENRESTLIFGTSAGGDINSWFTGFMLYEI